MFFGPDHFLGGLDVRPDANLTLYDRMTTGARVALLAGMGEADNLNVLGAKVGTLPQLFLFCTTHLLAHERDSAPLLEALRLGHSYVSFDYLGYVGAFTFFARVGDTIAMMGDEVRLAPGLSLKTECRARIESRRCRTAPKWRPPTTRRRSSSRRSRPARTESRRIAAAGCRSCQTRCTCAERAEAKT